MKFFNDHYNEFPEDPKIKKHLEKQTMGYFHPDNLDVLPIEPKQNLEENKMSTLWHDDDDDNRDEEELSPEEQRMILDKRIQDATTPENIAKTQEEMKNKILDLSLKLKAEEDLKRDAELGFSKEPRGLSLAQQSHFDKINNVIKNGVINIGALYRDGKLSQEDEIVKDYLLKSSKMILLPNIITSRTIRLQFDQTLIAAKDLFHLTKQYLKRKLLEKLSD